MFGLGSVVALVAPYSSFGRIMQNLFQPLYALANNALATIAERYDSYAFSEHEVWIRTWSVFTIAAVTFATLFILAWRGGRTYCNTICPVGTILGALSRHSIFAPVIDGDKCISCRLCERNCKAACINIKSDEAEKKSIDGSKCVVCMNCIDHCPKEAITFKRRKSDKTQAENPTNGKRRKFLSILGLTATSASMAQMHKEVDGGLAVILDKKPSDRETPIVPPGAQSLRNFRRSCTGCQLCVAQCPNNVLRPSTDLSSLMQPIMSFERGYCRPECNTCSQVCPAGAIRPIDLADKSSTQIGHAVWIKDNCIPLTDGVECGNCARHCPTGSIFMAFSKPTDKTSPKIPIINSETCIGCGACENLCPARPFSAIYVEGHENHKLI